MSTTVSGQIAIPEEPKTHELDLLIPKLAKDRVALAEIERRVQKMPSHHKLVLGDARDLGRIPNFPQLH